MAGSVAIIGGGAAGCFCSIELKRRCPEAEVTVYEAGVDLLAKVAVTGGGRCNLTNSFESIEKLQDAYPRGWQLMRRALSGFSQSDCFSWFENEGVRLFTQEDGCVFPVSQDAMQIVRTLKNLMRKNGVKVVCNHKVNNISELDADAIVLTSGGGAVHCLDGSGIKISKLVPSLYTFKIADSGIRSLMGCVVENASLSLSGTSFRSRGTLLLTDWGVSGPATLKLSSYAALYLAEQGWRATLLVDWMGNTPLECHAWLSETVALNGRKNLANVRPHGITNRLWKHILNRAGIREDMRCAELGTKGANRLVETLTSDTYEITGRARFKEEFVTCGGVCISEIDLNTLECKRHQGLYFAGEVLDIDAITGGFNLQAAWSTGHAVARAIAAKL